LDLDLVSEDCFCVRVQVFPYLSFSFVTRLFGTWRISGPLFVFSSLPPFLIGLSTLFGTPWAKGGVLTKAFGPQTIVTKICRRLSRLVTEPISPPASGLVQRLFPRQPLAWYGDYFSGILVLGAEPIAPQSSGLVRKPFPHEPLVRLVLSLVDSLSVIEMISFPYICLSFSLVLCSLDNGCCTIDNSISRFVLHCSQPK
jgi:hypothetical protein